MSLLPKRMALGDDFSLTLGSPIRPAPPAPAEQPKVAPSCMTNMLTSDVKGIIKASPTQPGPVEPVSRHSLAAGQYDCKIGAVGIYDDKVVAQLIIDESKLRVANMPHDSLLVSRDEAGNEKVISGGPLEFHGDAQMRLYGSARQGGKSFFQQHQQQIAEMLSGPRPEITNRTLQAAIKAKGMFSVKKPDAPDSKLGKAVSYLQAVYPKSEELIDAVAKECCLGQEHINALNTACARYRLEPEVRQYVYNGLFDALLPDALKMGGK